MATTSTITTGTVTTTGSKTYIVGTASGIDTAALVDTAYALKTAKADTIDEVILNNDAKITAYKTLQTLGSDLQTALDALNATYGYGVEDDSIYSQKKAYIAASNGTDTDNLLSISVADTAEKGSYSLEVIQLATAMKVTSDEQTSKTTALGYTGDFTLGLEGSDAVSFSVTADMTLQDIATEINARTADSGIKATVVKTSDNGYTLTLSGTETGKEIEYNTSSGNDIFASLGVTAADKSFAHVTQQAKDAIIKLDGLEISSSGNIFYDTIEGVTISLLGAAEGTTITLEVDYDYASTKEKITNFIDAYNALRDFVITNQSISSDGSVSEDAVLFSDTDLKSLNRDISNIISSIFTTDSGISTLGNIGITFDESNKLEISDEDALNNALLNNYASIQQLFQTSVEADSDNILLIRNTSSISIAELSMDIQTDINGNISSVSVNGDSSLFTFDGTRIIGATGTEYEGLTFVYAGTSSTTINISLHQGLADRLYNVVDKYTNTTTGSIQDAIDQTDDSNDRLDTEAARIRERADSYRDRLIERYAQMETNLSAANLLLDQIKAILGTDDDD